MSVVCQNLKYLRKQKSWTQQEFADKLGIKRSLLGAYEEERAEPRTEVLEQVSDMFRVSIDDLLRRDLGSQKENFLEKRRQLKLGRSALPSAWRPTTCRPPIARRARPAGRCGRCGSIRHLCGCEHATQQPEWHARTG